ncbi:hypothetical protein [Delftia acidovorans]|uniref:hypothetical protein n=1 Tax=Delftia acidovorans TaxID=80866 RepID=UPI001E4C4222|nr:hypothetical protein [Delftia acidovorans]
MAQYQTSVPRELSRPFDPAAAEQMEQLIQDFGRMYRERKDLLKEVTRAHRGTTSGCSTASSQWTCRTRPGSRLWRSSSDTA